jgi:hypothetical protein
MCNFDQLNKEKAQQNEQLLEKIDRIGKNNEKKVGKLDKKNKNCHGTFTLILELVHER